MTNIFYMTLAALVLLNLSISNEKGSGCSYSGIVISEFLPDPSPSAGLPSYEFIELTNTGRDAINLMGYAISNGSSVGVINRNYLLLPDSFLVLCSATAYQQYEKWGSAMAITGFPSLNNEEDTLLLFNPGRQLLQAIAYSANWHENERKAAGGWSLEIIDPLQPCLQRSNWSSSRHPQGGTPGQTNYIDGKLTDTIAPFLKRVYCSDSLHLVVLCNETIDSTQATLLSQYQLESNEIIGARALAPLYQELLISLAKPLPPGKSLGLTIRGLRDCSGNFSAKPMYMPAGLPVKPMPGDILINEILFDPPAGGKDFIELYNHSGKIIDLKEVWLANRDETGALKNLLPVSASPLLFFPGEWIALTEDTVFARSCFHPPEQARFLKTGLPSLPSDKGTIVLLDRTGKIMDEVSYDDHWHFILLGDKKGVSLERISYEQPAQQKENWTSASYPVRFATPGYENSQYHRTGSINGKITLHPNVISPNLDGLDDFCLVEYQFDQAGYMATVEIYDIDGRRVKRLLNNQLLGQSGRLRWDGLDEAGRLVAQGIYIVMLRAFHLSGKQLKWKGVVVKSG